MISYLAGNILSKHARSLTIDVRDVGYEVFVNAGALADLSPEEKAAFHIYSHIREDNFQLYGFLTRAEVDFFKMLLSVSGVGPRVAMEIMNLPLAEVRKAIVDEKTAWLTRTPGLGKKTAERLIVDLKDKIAADGVEGIQLDDDVIDLPQDVIDALTHLGYRVHHICRVLRSRPTELTEPEAVIKYFLQNM